MIARLRGRPTALRQVRPDLSPGLEKALATAMAASPDDRFATALEFAEALTTESGGGGLLKKIFK